MPAAVIRVEVPDVYGQRERIRAAAEGIARMIGDQPKGWEVSVSEAADQSEWPSKSRLQTRSGLLVFDRPGQQTEKAIVDQFRLNLKLYLSRE